MKILKKFGKKPTISPDPDLIGAEHAQVVPGGSYCRLIKAPLIHDITVFGFADCPVNSHLYKSVVKVSRTLAEAGYRIINGGGPGVMRASTEGAKMGGGEVVGITFDHKGMTNFEGRDVKNLFDKEIHTANYVERTLTLIKEGEVFVIFKGGTGTVSEFGMAWGLARLYFGHHKPLILYGNHWKKLIKAFRETMIIRDEELNVFKIVDSPEEVLEAICKFEEEIAEGKHDGHLKTTKYDSGFSL